MNKKLNIIKKFYNLLIALFFTTSVSAQLVISVVSQGVVNIKYGQTNDYSLYGPGFGTTTFYVYSWIPSASYDDAWSNSNVTLTYNSSCTCYEGNINLNTKLFTNTNNTLPANFSVNDIGMVFKNMQNGASSQSIICSLQLMVLLAQLHKEHYLL